MTCNFCCIVGAAVASYAVLCCSKQVGHLSVIHMNTVTNAGATTDDWFQISCT